MPAWVTVDAIGLVLLSAALASPRRRRKLGAPVYLGLVAARMTDLNKPDYDHGGGSVAYTGQKDNSLRRTE
jgi:hypothetical protein